MRRITVRLTDQHYQVVVAIAQELGTDVSSAIRSLITSHQRTQTLLDAIEQTENKILEAVASSRAATTENLKRTLQHLTQFNTKE